MKIEVVEKVYTLEVNYSGWEDPEANGCSVYLFRNEADAIKEMREMAEQEIKDEQEFDRVYTTEVDRDDYIRLVSQHGEYVEYSIMHRAIN